MDRFSDCVAVAFRQTKEMLWPFKSKVWLSLLLLNFITGGGFVSNVKFPAFPRTGERTAAAPAVPVATPVPLSKADLKKEFAEKLLPVTSFVKENKKTIVMLAGLLGAIGLLLVLLWTWLSSRLKMVLIKVLLTRSFELRSHWEETRAQGEALFLFNAVMSLAALVPFAITAAWTVSGFYHQTIHIKQQWPSLLLGAGVLLGYFVVWFVAAAAANRFLPIGMALTGRGPLAAVRELFSSGRANFLSALGPFGLYVLLAIGIGIATSMAMVIVVFAMMLLFGVGTLAGLLLAKAVGVPKIALAVVGIVLAIPCFLIFLALLLVPVETFKNYLGIELLS